MLTFVDTSVLIAAFRGTEPIASKAIAILDDPERSFASSDFVRLELLPKPRYYSNQNESEFHETFFSQVAAWTSASADLVQRAFDEACRFGLSAVDAMHVAAAKEAGATELVTTEKETTPLGRVTTIRVVSLRTPTP